MQTQGISLLMSANGASVPMKDTKVSDSTFDSFMNNHASKVSESNANNHALEVTTAANKNDYSKKTGTDKNMENHRLDTRATGQMTKEPKMISGKNNESNEIEAVDMAEMVSETMNALQKMFGLSEEELTDLMEQLGIQIQDLLFQVQGSMIIPLNKNAIQEFVLGIHGIDDPTAILTNDLLNQEITQLTQEIADVLANGFGVEVEELANLQENLQFDFAEQMQQFGADGNSEEQTMESSVTDMKSTEDTADGLSVVVETEADQGNLGSESDSSDLFGQTLTQSTDAQTQAVVLDRQSANVFTENLSQALEQVSNAEELSANRTMTQIVEQVVRQVKIRVMPETTSMELQLNPASLGRVNLTVSTTGGVATATMVVENQMAKNALESQMITLKETFAEQGLKVEEVEVTVAEFGLKKENQQQQNANDSKQNRRFRTDEELTESEDFVEASITASERRDANSMVDYTA